MVKIKTFALKQTLLKIERTSYRWRKHLQKYIPDTEGLVSKTYKEFSKLNSKKKKKIKQPNQKLGERHEDKFHQRNIKIANKHMKRGSTSLLSRGKQIK